MSFYKTKINESNIGLCWKFKVDETKCDNPKHYEDYLIMQSLLDQKQGFGTTYLYIKRDDETGEEMIMGYITLRTSSLVKDMGDSKKYGYPALEIAELAVDKNYIGRHVGTDMVMDTINIANDLNDIVSVKYVVLCSDKKAELFYKKMEFLNMLDEVEEIPREHCNINCIPMYIKLR